MVLPGRAATRRALLTAYAAAAAACASASTSFPFPSLTVVENTILTTAKDDFSGHAKAFEAAAAWTGAKLRSSSISNNKTATSCEEDGNDCRPRGPHLCCAGYEHGREVYSRLQGLLSPEAVRPISHSDRHGACFFATASHTQAVAILELFEEEEQDTEEAGHSRVSLRFAPFPSALKLAPGLLEQGKKEASDEGARDAPAGVADRLAVSHGALMRKESVIGLAVELSPGTLKAHAWEAGSFVMDLLDDLASESLDLHVTNFWSDPTIVEGEHEHLSTPGGAVRRRNWTKAAAVVHELSNAAGTSPADICSWDSITAHHAGDDLLLVSGVCVCPVQLQQQQRQQLH